MPDRRWFTMVLTLVTAALLYGCSTGGGGDQPAADAEAADAPRMALKVALPTQLADPFCVRIQVSGADFPAIVQDTDYPGGTASVDTVVPNIPAGENRTVELGIFEDGVCADLADADWYGIAEEVVVQVTTPTLVSMELASLPPRGTGSIIIRGERTMIVRSLHGEVVHEHRDANGVLQIDPVGGAECEIHENGNPIGTAMSGLGAADLGVLDTDVEVALETTELLLVCRHPDFRPAREPAVLVVDPANAALGTFVATVEMRPGLNTEVLVSTNERLVLRVNVPPMELKTVDSPFGEFQRIGDDAFNSAFNLRGGGIGNLSRPEIPVLTAHLALPLEDNLDGLVESINVTLPEESEVMEQVRLYPIQPPHRDAMGPEEEDRQFLDDESFKFDRKIYESSDSFAGEILSARSLGGTGDLNLVEVKMPAVDYDPARQVLRHYRSFEVEVLFRNTDCFRRVRVADDFVQDSVDRLFEAIPSAAEGNLLNWQIVAEPQLWCPEVFVPVFLGARLVIITHPDFEAAANDLRAHKIARGISTHVMRTDNIASPITDVAIRNYLDVAYNTWFIRPLWVLFMGDAEFVPTHYDLQNSWDTALNAGDIYYGQLAGGVTSVPVFGMGRFPVDSLAQAQDMVDKVKAFENNPPTSLSLVGNPFYSNLAFAAQFQDNNPTDGQAERWFAETSEDIRSHLVGQNLTVERIYEAPAASSPTLYQGGNPVPWYLRKPTFPWDGNTTDIINAFNAGRSIVYHRDHGWWSGWGTPSFGSSDINSVGVTGNEFPVVFSINCASGIFDNETVDLPANKVGGGYGPNVASVYWGEKFVRKTDGALAVIGDTRSSSTVLNNSLAQGLFDATWPNYMAYGPAASIRKLGDVLNHAKGFLTTQGFGFASLRQEMAIYNVLGDPTVEIKSRPPLSILIQPPVWEENIILIPVLLESIGRNTLPSPEPRAPIFAVAMGKDGEVLDRTVVKDNVAALQVDNGTSAFTVHFTGADIRAAMAEYGPPRIRAQ